MNKLKKKMLFEVEENETIDQCLDRIEKAGYIPIGRSEKPIFKEVQQGNKITYEPTGRKIIFEARKAE